MNIVSIVVPVYNVEKYLVRCINSLINQDFKNIEIILVDDGSSDSSGILCDNYAKKDNRIKVIHQKNGGMSAARNTGIDIATGDYIMFVDSDDEVASDIVSKLLDACISHSADISQCGTKYIDENDILLKEDCSQTSCLLEGSEKMKELLDDRIVTTMVWGKLYKSILLKNIRFPMGKYHEDIYFCYQIIHKSSNVYVINESLYYYRQVKGSIMHQTFNMKHLHALDATQERRDFIAIHYPCLLPLANATLVMSSIKIIEKIMDSNIKLKNEEKKLKKVVKKNLKDFIKYSRASNKTKIFARIMSVSLAISRVLHKVLSRNRKEKI